MLGSKDKCWIKLKHSSEYQLVEVRERGVHKYTVHDGRDQFTLDIGQVLPCSSTNSISDLMQMEYVNEAQLRKYLRKAEETNNYLLMSPHILLDTQQVSLQEPFPSLFEKFYFDQLHSFLCDATTTQSSIILSPLPSNPNTHHGYLRPLLHVISSNTETWCYFGRLASLHTVVSSLFCGINLQLQFSFNCHSNHKLTGITIAPYAVTPSFIPSDSIKMYCSSKAQQKYLFPSCLPTKGNEQLNKLIEGCLNLNFSPLQIHHLISSISIIANLHHLSIQSYQQYGKAAYRVRRNVEYKNLCKLAQFDVIVTMVEDGGECQADLQNRVKALAMIVYEYFVLDTCGRLSQKLAIPQHEHNKVFKVLSIDGRGGRSIGQVGRSLEEMLPHQVKAMMEGGSFEQYLNYEQMLQTKGESTMMDAINYPYFQAEATLYHQYKQLHADPLIQSFCLKHFHSAYNIQTIHQVPSLFLDSERTKYVLDSNLIFRHPSVLPIDGQPIKYTQFFRTILERVGTMRHQYEKEEVEMKLEEFIHRYQYTQQVKEIIWKKYGQSFHPYCKDKANKRYSEAIWEYITEEDHPEFTIFALSKHLSSVSLKNSNQDYHVKISREMLLDMEKQVFTQQIMIKKIYRQIVICLRRKKTLKITHKLFIQNKIQRILTKLVRRKKQSGFKSLRVYNSIYKLNKVLLPAAKLKKKSVIVMMKSYLLIKSICRARKAKRISYLKIGFNKIKEIKSKKNRQKVFPLINLIIQRKRKTLLSEVMNQLRQKCYKVQVKPPIQESVSSAIRSSVQMSKMIPSENFSKKKEVYMYVQPQKNLTQLTSQEKSTLQDKTEFSLETWQQSSFTKSSIFQEPIKPFFTKYQSLSLKKPQPLNPNNLTVQFDEYVSNQLTKHPFLKYLKTYIQVKENETAEHIMSFQQKELMRPLHKNYPIKEYPKVYKETFNSLLKIGGVKNTSKTISQLLNILAEPILSSYRAEEAKVIDMFEDSPYLPPDYSSNHNVIKDEIFLQFVKQIMNNKNSSVVDNYLVALKVFTRYYYPSTMFIWEFITCLLVISKEKNDQNLYQTLQNVLRFLEALQGNKGTEIKVFKEQFIKNDIECAGYLYLRKTKITELEIKQPLSITVRLLNNEAFSFTVRNQTFKSIKRKLLTQFHLIGKQKCFAFYALKKDNAFIHILENDKAIDFLCSKNSDLLLYLKIKHYFPFKLKQANISRLAYMNMIWEEVMIPWNPKDYEYIVATAMAYDEFEELRISNYLVLTKQTHTKKPNITPIEEMYKKMVHQNQKASHKVGEFQYMKYVKQLGFLLVKCYPSTTGQVIGVKPLEICSWRNGKISFSLAMKRLRNVYYEDGIITLELSFYSKENIQQIRTLTFKDVYQPKQLFEDILYHLQNNMK